MSYKNAYKCALQIKDSLSENKTCITTTYTFLIGERFVFFSAKISEKYFIYSNVVLMI